MIDRRIFLGLLGGVTLLSGCTHTDREVAREKNITGLLDLDPNNPEHLHFMHRKLAYRLNDGLTYWNIEALRMGFRDGVLTPFWKLHAGIVYKTKTLSEFRYSNQAILKIFYTDIKTGELLESFDNPYTGETLDVVQPKLLKTEERIFGLRGIEGNEYGAIANLSKNEDIGPARISGDDIWLNADLVMRSEPPNKRNRLLQVNDWLTYLGKMSELRDPNIQSANATLTFNDLNTFNHSWIGMDDLENVWSISRGFGRKSESAEGLPNNWKQFVAKTNPELLTDDPGFKVSP